jgi:hypothetical protein
MEHYDGNNLNQSMIKMPTWLWNIVMETPYNQAMKLID